MTTASTPRLASTIADIQKRWGPRAIQRACNLSPPAGLPTGIGPLDAVLPAAGFPRGKISELGGYGTAGHLLIAARALAQARRAIVVDVDHSVDPAILACCGVQLDALAILRPRGFWHALQMTTDLLRAGFAGAVLFDRLRALHALTNGAMLVGLEQALRDWTPLLARSATTMLWLTECSAPGVYPDESPLVHAADVRLLCERRRWLRQGRRVTGYVSTVTLVSERGAVPATSLTLRFPLI